jgi:hypothetical protein
MERRRNGSCNPAFPKIVFPCGYRMRSVIGHLKEVVTDYPQLVVCVNQKVLIKNHCRWEYSLVVREKPILSMQDTGSACRIDDG